MKKPSITILIFILSLASFGCGSDETPKWETCTNLQAKQSETTTSIATADNLVIYLDTSASMAGYVSPNVKASFAVASDGQTIFSKTLLELRNVVTTLSPQPAVALRKVDSNVSAPSSTDLELSQASINRATYIGKETNLAGAIKSFSEPIDKDAEVKTPAKFHILITDGVQSANKQNADTACSQGSDSFCVKKQILELLNTGWGGTIIGLRSEFQGSVFSEIAKSTLTYSSGKDSTKFRPFYLYIFSPDKVALDKLTENLKQRLSSLNTKPDSLHEFALSSNYASGIPEIEIDNPTKNLVEIKPEKLKEGMNPRFTVKTSVKTETEGVKEFTFKVKVPWSSHANTAGSPDELLGLLKWQLTLIDGDKEKDKLRYPNFKLSKQEIKDGIAYLTFETGWKKDAGGLAWRMYRLIGQIDESKSVPPWVKNWSTDVDTTLDSANKTLNLESSFGNLWKNNAMQSAAIADNCIRIGEK
jgi:hypothetical protein